MIPTKPMVNLVDHGRVSQALARRSSWTGTGPLRVSRSFAGWRDAGWLLGAGLAQEPGDEVTDEGGPVGIDLLGGGTELVPQLGLDPDGLPGSALAALRRHGDQAMCFLTVMTIGCCRCHDTMLAWVS
jgi:hypothetical protein